MRSWDFQSSFKHTLTRKTKILLAIDFIQQPGEIVFRKTSPSPAWSWNRSTPIQIQFAQKQKYRKVSIYRLRLDPFECSARWTSCRPRCLELLGACPASSDSSCPSCSSDRHDSFFVALKIHKLKKKKKKFAKEHQFSVIIRLYHVVTRLALWNVSEKLGGRARFQ